MELWPHQERVFDLLASGRNVILQAPTGSGKTRAALYPFLYALDDHSGLHGLLPRKCIYSVPMRVLAKQFHDEYEKTVKTYNLKYGLNISVAIQTGAQSEDREFKSNLIFATIDQTLSSFLIAPYSLPRRQANLNAAAVIGAYLVFDEFHLYEPDSMLPTTLHMLQMLKGITPFILMTATFSADMLHELAELLDAEVVPGTVEELEQLRTQESQQKTRRYHVGDQPLSARSVLDLHIGRALVICNQVDRARRLYEALCQAKDADTEVLLLHSRFLREDRDRIEDRIRAEFARGANDGSLIVVSTQAIEVGVDITCTRLHTELAPANAIFQRAGRCARYPGDEGDVYIYQYSADEDTGDTIDLCEDIMPYQSQGNQFTATLDQFRERSGETLDFVAEQEIVTAVHGPRDRQILNELQMGAYEHRRNMYSIVRGDALTDVKHLVRDVFQQQVTIHANPDELLDSPFDAPSFGLHPGTLQKYIKSWLERYNRDDSIPWVVKWLKQEPDPDQTNRSVYTWVDVYDNPRQVIGAPLVVVHPALATYDKTLGFLPDRGGTWQAELPEVEERTEPPRTYRLETYEDHIGQVYRAFTEMWPEMEFAARQLEERFGWTRGSIHRAGELAVLLHDVGKLSVKWQGWVQDYQQSIGQPVQKGQTYAHTELRTVEHREAEQRMGKRPWHAVEGAIAVVPILNHVFSSNPALAMAVYSAIARHHAPHSYNNGAFKLVKNAQKHILATITNETWRQLMIDLISEGQKDEDPMGENVIQLNDSPSDEEIASYLAYLLIARVLRLADQLGTARGAKGI